MSVAKNGQFNYVVLWLDATVLQHVNVLTSLLLCTKMD